MFSLEYFDSILFFTIFSMYKSRFSVGFVTTVFLLDSKFWPVLNKVSALFLF